MKHSARIYEDDLDLLDSINRMSRQLHFHANERYAGVEKSERLQLTIEEVEEQMETIRLSLQPHNHHR